MCSEAVEMLWEGMSKTTAQMTENKATETNTK